MAAQNTQARILCNNGRFRGKTLPLLDEMLEGSFGKGRFGG
jgi:hypothetical protein